MTTTNTKPSTSCSDKDGVRAVNHGADCACQAPHVTKPSTKPSTNRTPCPISKSRFQDKAAAMPITVTLLPRTFSTGSMGWFTNGKVDAVVDGVAVKCQINVTLTVTNSKGNSEEYKATFVKDAKPETLELTLSPRSFSTGSFGWSYAGKHWAQSRECQLSFNVTVANSKDAAAE